MAASERIMLQKGLLVLCLVCSCRVVHSASCPSLSSLLSNESLLANDANMRALFVQYGTGDTIPPEGLRRMLLDLGIPRGSDEFLLTQQDGTSDAGQTGSQSEASQKIEGDLSKVALKNKMDHFHDHDGHSHDSHDHGSHSGNSRSPAPNTPDSHDHNHSSHDHSRDPHNHSHDSHDHSHDSHDHSHDSHNHSHDSHDHSHNSHDHSHDSHNHSHDSHDHSHDSHGHDSNDFGSADYYDSHLPGDDPSVFYDDHYDYDCGNVSEALSLLALGPDGNLLPSSFLTSCPALIFYLLNHSQPGCFQYPGDPFLVQPVLGRPGEPNSRYDPRNPWYDPRNPGYDPRNRDRDPENRKRIGKMRNPEYDGRGRGYDRRDPRYDPRDPRYDPRNDPRNPAYDPRRRSWGRGRFDDRNYYPSDRDSQMQNRRRYELNRRGYSDQYPKRHPDYDYDYHEEFRRLDGKESVYARWIGGVVSMFLIGFISLGCTMLLPALRRSRHYDQANHFLLSLAVGTLAGDALIHLLPHAISMGEKSHFAHSDHNDNSMYLHDHSSSTHFKQALYGFTALMGIIIFLFLERLHNIRSGGKGHGHSHGSRPRRGSGALSQHSLGGNSTLPRNASLLLSDTAIDVIGLPPSQKIGKKLSEHSKEDSFNNTLDSRGDASRCFGGCPPQNRSSGGDPNGNTDGGDAAETANCVSGTGARGTSSTASTLQRDHHVLPVRRQPLKDRSGVAVAADLAERERLMNPLSVAEKLEMKPEKSDKHDDSSSVNIVLQEYHVSHHGHSHHGHAHVSGRKDSLRMMILMGEGMHIFMDGMAIGAAFATSLTGGIATAIAVLCHELPHKVGDFALLFDMGMTRKTALQMVVLMWLLSLVGMIIGEVVGSIEAASPWIYSFTAGIFLHLALVDLLSEVSVKGGETCSAAGQILLQMCGMLVGAGIMLLIAIYEHDLHNLLAWAF